METDDIILKTRQMLKAFDDLTIKDHQLTFPKTSTDDPTTTVRADGKKILTSSVSSGADATDLNNKADLVLISIYSLKEHLKIWCKENDIPFKGERLINRNKKNVALIHDLHNIRKHGKLNKKPRSGKMPKLIIKGEVVRDVEESLIKIVTTNDGINETTSVAVINPDGSPANISINARIEDGKGNNLGDFIELCDQSIKLWENELQKAGFSQTNEV